MSSLPSLRSSVRRNWRLAVACFALFAFSAVLVPGQQQIREGQQKLRRPTVTQPTPTQAGKPAKTDPTQTASSEQGITKDELLALRQAHIDQLTGKSKTRRLMSMIERGRHTAETDSITTSLAQDLSVSPEAVIPQGADTFNLVPVVTNKTVVSGPAFTLGDFGPDAAINDNGDIAFITGAGPFGLGTGVYKVSGSTVTPLALANQSAPLTGGGHFLGFLDVTQSPNGTVVFSAAIEGGVTTGGVFRVLGNQPSPIALTGQQIGGDVITNIGAIAVSSNNQIAFNATVNAVDINGNVIASGTEVFTFINNQLTSVARSGQVVNGVVTNTQLFSINDTNTPAGQSAISINSSGVVVFTAFFVNPDSSTGNGVFMAANGAITAIAATGQAATPGNIFTTNGLIGPVSLSDGNVVTFTGQFSNDPNSFSPSSGLFIAQPSQSPTVVIKSGDAVPGVSGFSFDGGGGPAFNSLAANSAGKLTFVGSFSNIQSIGAFNTGIFTITNGSPGSLTLVARDFSPISSIGSFDSFQSASLGGVGVSGLSRSLSINSSGTIAFTNVALNGASASEGVFNFASGAISSRVTDQTALPNSPTLIDFENTKMNSAGSIVFSAAIVGSVPGVFLSQNGNVTVVAMEKAPAPGTGTNFTGVGDAVVDSNNRVVFVGAHKASDGSDTMGVFMSSGGSLTAVAVKGQTLAPQEIINFALSPGFGANGAIILIADNSPSGNPTKDTTFNSCIFSTTGGSFTQLVKGAITTDGSGILPGDPAPGTSAKFTAMVDLTTNGSDIAFNGRFSATPFKGLFQISSGTVTSMIIPPTPLGDDDVSELTMNAGKQVAYVSGRQVNDFTAILEPGLYLTSAGSRNRLVNAGDQLQGFPDQLLPIFLSNNLSDSGKIVFTAMHSSILGPNSTPSFTDERAAGLSTFVIPAGENPDNGGHISIVATNGSFIEGTAGTVAASIGSAISPNGNIIVTAIVHGSIDVTDAILQAQPNTAPTIHVTQPAAGDSIGGGLPATVKWSASDDVGLVGFDINLSTNGGASFVNVGHAFGFTDNFSWQVPVNLIGSTNAVIQVAAFDTAGAKSTANSGVFSIKSAGPKIATVTLKRGVTALGQINAGTNDLSVTLTGANILAGAQVLATDSSNNQTQTLTGTGSAGAVTATIPKLLIAQPKTLLLSVVNPGTAPSLPVSVAVNGPTVMTESVQQVFSSATLIGYDITLTGKNLTPPDLQPFAAVATVKNGSNPVTVSNIVVGSNSLTVQVRSTFPSGTLLSVQVGYTGVTSTNVLAKVVGAKIP